MTDAVQVNRVPIQPHGPFLTTYEVTCVSCGQTKWPSLPEKPDAYTCVLCSIRSVEQRERARSAGRASAEKRRLQGTPGNGETGS